MSVFETLHQDKASRCRLGRLKTAHGTLDTPVFMPVGTRGSVKGLMPEQVKQTDSTIILANTYHMMIRPGEDTVEKLGGLHKFMAWDGPILTDSGGYQVFSLGSLNRIGDDGVEFASHIDGKRIYIDAAAATKVQNKLGADIIMCFDECAPYPCEQKRLEQAVERTIRWAGQCKQAHKRNDQLLFGIVQGGVDKRLREFCSRELIRIGFDGYAIGGLSVGEGHELMIETTRHTAELLPADKPRYLMGVGMPVDIIAAVKAGVDMFDCVLPTRNGRNATVFTWDGVLKLRNSVHADDPAPIEKDCDCYCCKNFSRAAVRHFFNVGEMAGPILASIHNIRFYQRLMAQIKRQIKNNTFDRWADEMIIRLDAKNTQTQESI